MSYTDELFEVLIKNSLLESKEVIRDSKINAILENFSDENCEQIRDLYNFYHFLDKEFEDIFLICRYPIFNLIYLDGSLIKKSSIAVKTLLFDSLQDIRDYVNKDGYCFIIYSYSINNGEHRLRGNFFEKQKILSRNRIINKKSKII